MLQEFKSFAMRGNMIDLAIAFVLGVAFAAVITSIVDDLLMPIIGAIVSGKDFSELTWDVGGASVRYGNFINTVVMFLIIAWILFMIVRSINRIQRPAAEDPAPNTKECPYCLSAIPLLATRCPNCTSEVSVTT
jgi:large conductance mechanosensitive channel